MQKQNADKLLRKKNESYRLKTLQWEVSAVSKKKFYNSDAHYISEVGVNKGNFHAKKITTLDDLVSFIKTPNEPNTLSLIYQNCER